MGTLAAADLERSASTSSTDSGSQSTQYSAFMEDLTPQMLAYDDSIVAKPLQPTASSSSLKRKFSPDVTDTDPSPVPSSKLSRSASSVLFSSAGGISALDPIVSADPPGLRDYMENTSWGFKWEVARFMSAGLQSSELINPHILKADGSKCNAEAAPAVSAYVKRLKAGTTAEEEATEDRFAAAFAQEKAAKSPWEELDREEKYKGKSMDFEYLFDEEQEWYGGKVHYTGRLKLAQIGDKCQEKYHVELNRPYLGSSTRFTRKFGSSRFVRIRVEERVLMGHGPDLIQFFKRPFIIFKKVFRAFYTKEGTVFLLSTNEEVEVITVDGTTTRVIAPPKRSDPLDPASFLGFIYWHNSLEYNSAQTMAKWASRFALGLSNSVPGIRLAAEHLHKIPDIISGPSGSGKAPAELTMTDGCGFANANFFRLLHEKFRWDTEPTAVQVRIQGAKGLLVLHPDHSVVTTDRIPEAWIRPSQTKVIYPPGAHDAAYYTVDILRSSHMASPARLAVETIINFADNGVNHDVLKELMHRSFESKIDGLTTWTEGDSGLFNLWHNVMKEGRVIPARLARQNAGSARAKGYVYEDPDEDEEVDEEVDEDSLDAHRMTKAMQEQSIAWWDNPVSGQPSSLEETVMMLLLAGFHPTTSRILRDKLKVVAEKSIKSLCNKYRFVVPMSCSAFVIPDPCGVLEPGEVHIKSSHRNLTGSDGKREDIVIGDVLLTRHPCKVPTDVQKAKAVFKFELRNYVDVIVVSTKGHVVNGEVLSRHLASMTGGGDYDGDLMQAFWDPAIVKDFKPADPKFANEPDELQSYLEKVNKSVDEFESEIPKDAPYETRINHLQTYLLGTLRDASIVGRYSTFWEHSIYQNGYRDQETLMLASLFCTVLDGAKTGISVDSSKFDEHKKKYSARPALSWKDSKEGHRFDMSNAPTSKYLDRPKHLGVFIMDDLKAAVDCKLQEQMSIIGQRLRPLGNLQKDSDLAKPWEDFLKRVDANVTTLGPVKEALMTHVKALRVRWQAEIRDKPGYMRAREASGSKDKQKHGFTSLPIEKRQDIFRALARKFLEGPAGIPDIFSEDELARLKVSYAYVHDWEVTEHKTSNFPFDVDMRTLCAIKAKRVSGNTEKTVTAPFYMALTLHKAFLDQA